jgi:uncharacterized protein
MNTISNRRLSASVTLAALLGVAPLTASAQQYSVDMPDQTVVAGSVGGSWFIISTAIMDLADSEIEGFRYTVVPGGGVANPLSVQRGEASMGMGYTTNLFAAYTGLEAPYDTPTEDIRGIINMNVASIMHPWVLAERGVSTLQEVAEQQMPLRIDTGTRGTGGELAAMRALEAHGVSYENIRQWGGSVTHSSYSEAIDRMRDGHIDAFMNDDILRHPLFVDLTSSRDVVLLDLDPDIIASLADSFGYDPVVVPAGTYEGQDNDVHSFAQHHVLFGHKDLPEDFVYALTRLVFENKDRLVSTHEVFSDLDPAVGGTGFPMPLHPGAERYYREIGVLND